MSALHGFWDWALFSVTVFFLLYAFFIFLNMIILMTKGVGFSFGALFIRLVLFVFAGIGGYWVLFRHLGVF